MINLRKISPLVLFKLIAVIAIGVWSGAWYFGTSYAGQHAQHPSGDYGDLEAVRIAMVHAFEGVNPQDARVAIDLHWTKHLEEVFPGLDSRFDIVPDVNVAEHQIRSGQLHALSMSIGHFLKLKDRVNLKPVFISSRVAQPLESYLLLVQKGMDWKRLGSLSSRRLLTEKMTGPAISRMWLETKMREKGLSKAEIFFQEIIPADKPARIILPVFFGQADACLVPESAFQTMVELNPQIRQRLTILDRSPGLIKTIHCVSDAMPRHMVATFIKKGMRMDDTVSGRQLLIIFHVKRNFEFKPVYLENSERIYQAYLRIVGKN